MFWAPKIASEAISQHQIKKFFLGEHAPTPPSFCVQANVRTRVYKYRVNLACYIIRGRTNEILLTPGFTSEVSDHSTQAVNGIIM